MSEHSTDATRRGPASDLLHYFLWAFIVTVVGLALGALLGWQTTGTLQGTLTIFFICAVLAVLEISLSFDNAIVNANKLKDMTPVWQRRFLTWGILIAVFGMRIVFPLLIVVIAAKIGPWEAVVLAASEPEAAEPAAEAGEGDEEDFMAALSRAFQESEELRQSVADRTHEEEEEAQRQAAGADATEGDDSTESADGAETEEAGAAEAAADEEEE